VQPRRGRALLWPATLDADPFEKDERTHHEALPVTKGTKRAPPPPRTPRAAPPHTRVHIPAASEPPPPVAQVRRQLLDTPVRLRHAAQERLHGVVACC
jgi:hypothetical protein